MASVDTRVQLMSCYKISDFACAQSIPSITVIPTEYNIRIGSFTTITPIPDTGDIVSEYYHFCDDKMLDNPSLQSNIIIDYIGILQVVDDKLTKDSRPYVVLTMSDTSTNLKQIKLWQEISTNPARFNRDAIETAQKPVILGFTALRTHIFQGALSLNSTAATYVYLHPKHSATTDLENMFAAVDVSTTQGVPITIASLLEQADEQLLGKTFVCDAFIHDYKTNNGWYYTKCPQCSGTVWDSDSTWLCTSDGYITKPSFMFRVIAIVKKITTVSSLLDTPDPGFKQPLTASPSKHGIKRKLSFDTEPET